MFVPLVGYVAVVSMSLHAARWRGGIWFVLQCVAGLPIGGCYVTDTSCRLSFPIIVRGSLAKKYVPPRACLWIRPVFFRQWRSKIWSSLYVLTGRHPAIRGVCHGWAHVLGRQICPFVPLSWSRVFSLTVLISSLFFYCSILDMMGDRLAAAPRLVTILLACFAVQLVFASDPVSGLANFLLLFCTLFVEVGRWCRGFEFSSLIEIHLDVFWPFSVLIMGKLRSLCSYSTNRSTRRSRGGGSYQRRMTTRVRPSDSRAFHACCLHICRPNLTAK